MLRPSVGNILLGIICGLHALLAVHTAWSQSSVWDEVVYPAAGYDLLATGRIRTNVDHPPLAKAIYGLTLLPFQSRINYPPDMPIKLDAFRFGFQMISQNPSLARWMIFLPRLAAVALSLTLLLLIYKAGARRWGMTGALVTAGLYAFSPPVLARASLALLEMPLVVFMMGAILSYVRCRETANRTWLWGWILCSTAALLCKATALILFPIFLLSEGVLSSDRRMLGRRLLGALGVAFAALALAEGVDRCLGVSYLGTQILPRNAGFFLNQFTVFFHGKIWKQADWYFSIAAWLMKTPIPLLLLAISGGFLWIRRFPRDPLAVVCIVTILVSVILMVTVRSIIATGHYFLLYPMICLLAAGVAERFESPFVKGGLAVLGLCLVTGTMKVHPHHLAYFNIGVGGSAQGHRWLWDSDQDWGQGLPSLSIWMKQKGLTQILLGYSGAGDPRIYGIPYQDFISPALVSRIYRGDMLSRWPESIVLVVSDRLLQTIPEEMAWLVSNRRPVAHIGYTLQAFDLTRDPEGLQWVAQMYRLTRRPAAAQALLAAASHGR